MTQILGVLYAPRVSVEGRLTSLVDQTPGSDIVWIRSAPARSMTWTRLYSPREQRTKVRSGRKSARRVRRIGGVPSRPQGRNHAPSGVATPPMTRLISSSMWSRTIAVGWYFGWRPSQASHISQSLVCSVARVHMFIRWSGERESKCKPVARYWSGHRPRTGREKTWFLVVVVDGGHVSGDDLEVCLSADVVPRHFEHAEMEIGHWAEGAARDEGDGGFGAITEGVTEPVGGQMVGGH